MLLTAALQDFLIWLGVSSVEFFLGSIDADPVRI